MARICFWGQVRRSFLLLVHHATWALPQKGRIAMKEYSTSALDRHLVQHEKLVHWVVHRQWLGSLPYLEAVQAGRIGLWHALQRYDPERGLAFTTYAVPAIRRAVWQAVKQAQRLACACVPRAWPTDEEGDQGTDWDLVERVHQHLVREAVYQMVRCLPARLAYVVIARYGLAGDQPQTWVAIGQTLRVTHQRAHQLHTEALLWLAHPAHSVNLRKLVNSNTVAAYRVYLGRLRAWQRATRRKR